MGPCARSDKLATGAQIGNSATGNVAAANRANIDTGGIMKSGYETATDAFTKQDIH